MLRQRIIKKGFPSSCVVPSFFDGDKFVSEQTLVIPSHDEYNLNDLVSAGVKVSPVDTAIVHDDMAVNNLLNLNTDNNNNTISNNNTSD